MVTWNIDKDLRKMSKANILGIKIDKFTLSEAVLKLDDLLARKRQAIICTPNTEMIMLSKKDAELKDILNNRSSMNLADGFGLLWAAKFDSLPRPENYFLRIFVVTIEWVLSIIFIPIIPSFYRKPIPEKISGSDFVFEIVKFAVKNNLKVFLLGGGPTIAERTALELQTKTPELKIAGVYSGSSNNNVEILKAIEKSRADILLVAFGAPKQEKWLAENLKKTNCKIGIGLGGTFDFISGVKNRAPIWMQKSGLEWLFRLSREPSRIKRQMALPKFLWTCLTRKLQNS